MSNYRLSLLCLMMLWAFGVQAKIVVAEPYKISTRMINGEMVIKIAGHSLKCGAQCGYNLSLMGRIPQQNELIVKGNNRDKYVSLTIFQASCCVAAHIIDVCNDEGIAVEDTFLISEIFSEKPELIEQFNQGMVQVRLGVLGQKGKYVRIKQENFRDEETKLNWRQDQVHGFTGTMR